MLPGFTNQLKAVYDMSVRTRPKTTYTAEVKRLATLAPQTAEIFHLTIRIANRDGVGFVVSKFSSRIRNGVTSWAETDHLFHILFHIARITPMFFDRLLK